MCGPEAPGDALEFGENPRFEERLIGIGEANLRPSPPMSSNHWRPLGPTASEQGNYELSGMDSSVKSVWNL